MNPGRTDSLRFGNLSEGVTRQPLATLTKAVCRRAYLALNRHYTHGPPSANFSMSVIACSRQLCHKMPFRWDDCPREQ